MDQNLDVENRSGLSPVNPYGDSIVLSPPRSISGGSPGYLGSPVRLHSPAQLASPQQSMNNRRSVREDPRLVIRKLVLINYKSYAGRQEVGPFNDNFTAVVGPNGSGKSNVIDSLLFVFGFRAKKMRHDKLTGLIHHSEKEPNLTFAKVEVHFETLGIEDSELVLAREVHKDGTSFYSLNGSRCTYGEISELLEKRGIDLKHKRFLILQGEVESIALMPPKAENDSDDGLLEYLEDIIGTSSYKTRIGELEEDTERLKQDVGEKQRRTDLVFKDLSKLDDDRAMVETFIVNKNRSTVLRSQLYQLHRHQAQQSLNSLVNQLEDQQSKLESIKESLVETHSQFTSTEGNIHENQTQAESLKQQIKVVASQLNEIKLRKAKAKQARDQLEARVHKAEHDLKKAKNEMAKSQNWLGNYQTDTSALEQRLSEVKAKEVEQQALVESLQRELHEKTQDMHDELQRLQQEAEPWRLKIADVDHQLKLCNTEEAEAQAKVERAVATEEECVKEAEIVIANGKAAKQSVKDLSNKLTDLEQEKETTETRLKEVEEEHTALKKRLNQLKPEVRQAQESTSSNQSRNRIEQVLKQMKIPGLYGRLGSLGSIDMKYDVAISTAAPELNNFVVDNVETAKICVQVLREKNLGRARFMVLNKVKSYASDKSVKLPATRLLDLVTPKDPVLQHAFASVLGDTLVVDTPEEANRVAFQGKRRFKVVTMGGVLVKSSGQMSGGGSPNRGLMNSIVGSAVSAEELSLMEKELTKTEFEVSSIGSKYADLQSKLEEIERELPITRLELEKTQISLDALGTQILSIRAKRRTIQDEVSEAKKSQASINEQIKARIPLLQEEKQQHEDHSQEVEESIRTIQGKILQAGGTHLREQAIKVKDLQDESRHIQQRIDESQEKLGKEISRLKKFTEESLRCENELNQCAQSGSSIEEEPGNVRELELEAEKLKAELQAMENGSDDDKRLLQELKQEIERFRGGELEAKNEIERLAKQTREKEKRLHELSQSLQSLRLYDESVAKQLHAPEKETQSMHPPPAAAAAAGLADSADSDVEMEDAKPIIEGIQLVELSPDELESLDDKVLVKLIQKHDKACEGKSYDEEALKRYQERYTEYSERKQISDVALNSFENAKRDLENTKDRRYKEFMDGFYQISAKLKELYQLITMGGNAELELVDSMDPFSEGILFSVMPPKKSWRNISNLSGGEKTLSSLALVFALHHYKPTPLYVMDEIDAALDFRNVSIIANYIKDRTKNGQFIVISLRNNMFELASRLVGVYKTENMTKSVTLQIGGPSQGSQQPRPYNTQ